LCGTLGAGEHWSEPTRADALAQRPAAATLGRERQARIRLANRVLAHYGLALSDFAGSRYVLRSRTGRSVLIEHLGALWPTAEQLSGRTCDPLDPALLAALQRETVEA
jgi:hypothetical protein